LSNVGKGAQLGSSGGVWGATPHPARILPFPVGAGYRGKLGWSRREFRSRPPFRENLSNLLQRIERKILREVQGDLREVR